MSLLLHVALAVLLWQWHYAPAPPAAAARRSIEVRLLAAPLLPDVAAERPSSEMVAPLPTRAPSGNKPVGVQAAAAVIAPTGSRLAPELATTTGTSATAPLAPSGATEASSEPASAANPPEDRQSEAERALGEEYRQRLWAAIAAAKPPGIRLAGEALVSFTLDPAGQLLSVEISRSSGNALLDKLALRCVRRAAPFPPPPAALSTQGLRFSIAFQFS